MVHVHEDMTGWVLAEHGVKDSLLTVLYRAPDYISPQGKQQIRYACKCSCGSDKIILVSPTALKQGKTKSCGCLRKPKGNKYDLSNDFGIGYCSNTGHPFYFDLVDYDKIKDYTWAEIIYTDSGYHELRTTITGSDGIKRPTRMHQLLCGEPRDHADRNPLNNRRSNLRPASAEENNRNRTLFQNNTSGIMGVNFEPKRNGWRARLYVSSKRLELGVFKEKDDAIKARLEAELKYYGDFAPQRHLFKEYNIIQKEGI